MMFNLRLEVVISGAVNEKKQRWIWNRIEYTTIL